MNVTFLGIPGSFSYAAARAFFGTEADYQGAATFQDIFAAVNSGQADSGVIPIENSLAGSIYDNYDLLDGNNLHVRGEHYLRVSHCLLGMPTVDKSLKKVTKAYSHPKALEQCSQFFKAHPWIERCTFSDTAAAARFVNGQQDASMVAIASEEAATLYGLAIVKKGLEDNPHNITRFLVVAKESDRPIGADKCSVILRLPHVPGSLYATLGVLAKNHCNLTKIESRPLIGKPFEYIFYLDFCFDTASKPIKELLADLKELAPATKVLGVYKSALPSRL